MTDGRKERQAIEKAVQTYLDGLYEGDTEKLASVFHPTSALTANLGGELKIVSTSPARPRPSSR